MRFYHQNEERVTRALLAKDRIQQDAAAAILPTPYKLITKSKIIVTTEENGRRGFSTVVIYKDQLYYCRILWNGYECWEVKPYAVPK